MRIACEGPCSVAARRCRSRLLTSARRLTDALPSPSPLLLYDRRPPSRRLRRRRRRPRRRRWAAGQGGVRARGRSAQRPACDSQITCLVAAPTTKALPPAL
jgi:hypothetical protein